MDDDDYIAPAVPARRRTRQARVAWRGHVVTIGGDAPVRVQAMTNTDTADAIGTAIQVKELATAGSEPSRGAKASARHRVQRPNQFKCGADVFR